MVWSSVFSRAHHHQHENPEPHPSFESCMMEDAVSAAEGVVLLSSSTTTLFDDSSNREGATVFLNAVADLQRAMHLFVGSKDRHGQEVLARAHRSTQAAMARLQKEFYQLLSDNRHTTLDDVMGSVHCYSQGLENNLYSLNEESSYHRTQKIRPSAGSTPAATTPAPPPQQQQLITDLRSIAESMVKYGHGNECFKAYESVRKSAVDEALFRLGFPRVSSLTTQHPLSRLKSWPHAARKAVRSLFSAERALCDGVFGFADDIRESAFAEVAGEGAAHLFAFPETAAKAARKSPEKMFELLEAYSALVELMPELDSIFSHGYTSGVKVQAASSLEKLAEAVRSALAEFEDAVHTYVSSKGVPVPGGAIHPLTRYAMNYLAFLADYGPALSEIFDGHPLPPHKPLPENFLSPPSATPPTSPPHFNEAVESSHGNVASHVAWLVLVILCRLDSEAGFYKDNVPLAYLFLANNLTYIRNKVSSSGLRLLLGSDWVAKQGDTARNYAKTYQQLAWKEVTEPIPRDPSKLSPISAAETVRRFSAAFEDACRQQAGWVVPDDRMREEIKESIANKVVMPYGVLYDAWRGEPVVAGAVRFTPQDVNNYLSDFFQGQICFTFPASGRSVGGDSSVVTS